MAMNEYQELLLKKKQLDDGSGFEPLFMPDFLFDFQTALVEWSVKMGRSAMFADCGMGKTPMQLVWAENMVRKTNKPTLIVAPLSVSVQTVDEATKFDIEAVRSMDGTVSGKRIIVTNYERLHHFNPHDFGAVVCDESSIMKNFDGVRRTELTEFMRKTRYRLLCTATAAPNDYIELGTSSEALGYLGHMDMLSMFFKNESDGLHPAFIGSQWRFKRHAEADFWRWMVSWARACRRPSDLGFDDGDFVLKPLHEVEHQVSSPILDGYLISLPAITLSEQREDSRATVEARCVKAAETLDSGRCAVSWCNLNAEADMMTRMIPGAVQVKGADKDERKEEVFAAFANGEIKNLVTKPKIAAFGMNWQHCSQATYFPTHSFEQYYQAIRRFWRFGQPDPVTVHIVTSESQGGVLGNMQRKEAACEKMFNQLVEEMNNALNIDRMNDFETATEIPAWL